MKTFGALLAAGIAATILRLTIDWLIPGFMTHELFRNSIDPLGNLLFVVLLGLVLYRYNEIEIITVRTIIAVLAFLATILVLSFVGIATYEASGFGLSVLALIGTIGYYPAGSDVPIDYGIPLWVLSSLVPIYLGLVLGVVLRRFGPRRFPTQQSQREE